MRMNRTRPLRWAPLGGAGVLALTLLSAVPASASQPTGGPPPAMNTPVRSGSSVSISWIDKDTLEDGYAVFRITDVNGARSIPGVIDMRTPNKAGTGKLITVTDTSPNELGCYMVIPYDDSASYDFGSSEDCVNGLGDPTDPALAGTRNVMAAASLDSVQVSGTSVTVTWTDRDTRESAFPVFRRDASIPNWLANNNYAEQEPTEVVSTTTAGTGHVYTYTDTIPAGTDRWCYTIMDYDWNGFYNGNLSNEMCTSPLSPPAAPAAGSGSINAPDLGARETMQTSMAIAADGLGLVAYGASSNPNDLDLKVSHCTDAQCDTSTVTTLDSDGYTGNFPSLKIGSDGLGIVSYEQWNNNGGTFVNDIKVAHCQNVACTSATITTIDPAATVSMLYSSLTIANDGFATITYVDSYTTSSNSVHVKRAHCQNTACTSYTTSTVDTVFNPGNDQVSSATSTTGVTYVSYPSLYDVKVAACYNTGCLSAYDVVRSTGVYEEATTQGLTIGRDGLPLFTYQREQGGGASGDLVVARCVNIYCSGVTKATADTGGFVGYSASIAIGADDLGVVSYYDGTNQDLKVAHCIDLICSSTTNTAVDEFAQQGLYSSITIGSDGLPMISYLDGTDNLMKVAHCSIAACSGDFVVPF
jgi:hypothetical protein